MKSNYLLETSIRDYNLRAVRIEFEADDVLQGKVSGKMSFKRDGVESSVEITGYVYHGDASKKETVLRLLYREKEGAFSNLLVLRQAKVSGLDIFGLYDGKMYNIIAAIRPTVAPGSDSLADLEGRVAEFDTQPPEFAGALRKV